MHGRVRHVFCTAQVVDPPFFRRIAKLMLKLTSWIHSKLCNMKWFGNMDWRLKIL